MSNEIYSAEHLSAVQVIDLLSLALTSSNQEGSVLAELERLTAMPPDELLRTARDRLDENGLSVTDAAHLVGTTELTAKRWFEVGDSLAEGVKPRLAGLCFLLSFEGDEADESGAARLADAAISLVRGERDQTPLEFHSGACGTVASAFGASGLMAAALHCALKAECADVDPEWNG